MKWKGTVSQAPRRPIAAMFAPAKASHPRSTSLGRIEAVPGMPDRADRDVCAQLLPQAANADVDDVGAGVEVVAPDLGEQALAAQDLARIGGELVEQLELAVGELDDGVAGARLPAGWGRDERPDLERVGLLADPAPADMATYACQQLVERGRLRHVGTGTPLEAAQLRG